MKLLYDHKYNYNYNCGKAFSFNFCFASKLCQAKAIELR